MYSIGKEQKKIDSITIPLTGEKYQNICCIQTDNAFEIDGISLEYDKQKAKWDLNTTAAGGGDIDNIDTNLAQKEETILVGQSKSQEEQLLEIQKQELEKEKQQIEAQKQELEKQKQNQTAQNQPQQTVVQEQPNLDSAWKTVESYGKNLYPYGFDLKYSTDKLAEEKDPDGSWYLEARCMVQNEYGDTLDSYCEAVVRGNENNWTIEQFYIDDTNF